MTTTPKEKTMPMAIDPMMVTHARLTAFEQALKRHPDGTPLSKVLKEAEKIAAFLLATPPASAE